MLKLYLVVYDIRDPKRWRAVYQLLNGYGEWLQLSVFQCLLDRTRRIKLEHELREHLNLNEDHLIIIELGSPEFIKPRITSLGKPFVPLTRNDLII